VLHASDVALLDLVVEIDGYLLFARRGAPPIQLVFLSPVLGQVQLAA
jgi:hypothetical protein